VMPRDYKRALATPVAIESVPAAFYRGVRLQPDHAPDVQVAHG
jgi:hypothetical protein